MTTQTQLPPIDVHGKISTGAGGGDFAELELLPEREWLQAGIQDVEYCYAEFKGQIQYMTDKDGNTIEKDGQPIPRKQFKITFDFMDYELGNGSPRKAWLRLGASFHEKAKLPTFLQNMGVTGYEEMTPQMIMDAIMGQRVQLQLENKPGKDGRTYQNVISTAVKVVKELDDSDAKAWDE